MDRTVCLVLLLVLAVFPGRGLAEPAGTQAAPNGLTAEEILKRADDVLTSYEDQSLTSTLTVIDSDGTEKVRELLVWQKGDMRLLKFVQPPSERGIGLLALDSKTNYVYLPAYQRVRRVAAHVRNQTFMGTGFTQTDMSLIRYGTDYLPELLDETDTHWRLALTPKPDSDVGYGKLVITVGKERFEVRRIDYYDKGGNEKLKVEERSDFNLYDGKHYNAATLTVTTIKDNRQTIMTNSNYQFDQGLPDDYFTTRNLKRPLR